MGQFQSLSWFTYPIRRWPSRFREIAMRFLEFDIPNGRIRVEPTETSSSATGYGPAGVTGDLVKYTNRALQECLAAIAPTADAVLAAFAKNTEMPKSVAIELGVAFDVEGNVFLASAHAESSFKITCTWEK
jgi:hypothetical protein